MGGLKMQLGNATLVEVKDERNTCKYEWKFVLFEFTSARDKAETARLRSCLEASEKRRLELEEACQSRVLEIESLKHKVTTTSTEKIRGEVFLTIGLGLYMLFHHTEPLVFVSLTLLVVVYGSHLLRLATAIRLYASRQVSEMARRIIRLIQRFRQEARTWSWKSAPVAR